MSALDPVSICAHLRSARSKLCDDAVTLIEELLTRCEAAEGQLAGAARRNRGEEIAENIRAAMEATNTGSPRPQQLVVVPGETVPRINCDTNAVDGDGRIVVTLFDPFTIPTLGQRVMVRDEYTGEQFQGVIGLVDVDHDLDDGIVRVDLRIGRAE